MTVSCDIFCCCVWGGGGRRYERALSTGADVTEVLTNAAGLASAMHQYDVRALVCRCVWDSVTLVRSLL